MSSAQIIRQNGVIPTTAQHSAMLALSSFHGAPVRLIARVAGDGRRFQDGTYVECSVTCSDSDYRGYWRYFIHDRGEVR